MKQLVCLVLIVSCLSTFTASAGLIRVEFTGDVTLVESEVAGTVDVGNKIEGYYEYNFFDAPNELTSVEIGRYSVITEFHVSTSGYSWMSHSNTSYIQIRNRPDSLPFPNEERYSVVGYGFERIHTDQLYLNTFSLFTPAIADSHELDDISLIDDIPFSANIFSGMMNVSSLDAPNFNRKQIHFDINTINVATVPEPSTVLILMLSLFGLVLHKKVKAVRTTN